MLEYRGLWIGVGDKSVVNDDGRSTNNPSAQFEVFNNPPRLTSAKKTSLTRQLRASIQILQEEVIDDAADDSVDDMNRNQYADQIEKGRNVMLKEK